MTTDMPVSLTRRAQQAEDLGLHGDVQRGGGLVGDQQPRLAGECQGDGHALGHAAGDLVRVGLQDALGVDDAHLFAAGSAPRPALRPCPTPRSRRMAAVSW